MIMLNDFFTDDSLNIFTDASMNSYGTCGCIGVCAVKGKIDKRFPLLNTEFHTLVINKCTNNIAEGRAIINGIYLALRYRNNYKTIRILSDSMLNIVGIRDRILKWRISKKKDKDGFSTFIGSAGQIMNQDIFLEALYTILQYDLSIEFLHQKGHTSFSDPDSLIKMGESFKKINNISSDTELDIELLRSLAFYNNYVDRNSRDILYSVDMSQQNYVFPFEYKLFDGYDKEAYRRLVNPDSIFTKN